MINNKLIIPTVFAKSNKGFYKRFEKIRKIARNVQIDIMDGKFVGVKSISLKDIPNLGKYANRFEAHLMVLDPNKLIKICKNKGFKKIIFHVESEVNIDKAIEEGRKYNMGVFIAINPSSSLDRIKEFVVNKQVEGVLLLGVYPGREGQKLWAGIFSRIKEIKKMNKQIIVQIDGGVNDTNALKLRKAGANILNSGSYIANSQNPEKTLRELEKSVNL